MGSNQRCPVGSERIDQNAARVNGAIVMVVLAASFVPTLRPLQFYLLVDFAVKVFVGFAYSPNCYLSQVVVRAFDLPVRWVPAAPKRFASAVALVFLTGALVSWFAAESAIGFFAFSGVFLVCAFLESAVGFCVGCFVYGLLPTAMSKPFVR